jgi:hypothetical protein
MTQEPPHALGAALPRELGAALRPRLPDLADEILAELARSVAEYDRPLQGEFGRVIRVGVEEALARFVEAVEAGGELPAQALDVYRALGRGELREGRSLDALQSAYRIGARVAWRRIGALADEAGYPPEDQRALAEAIFAYIEELSAASVEGYAQAQTAAARERDRRRRRLLEALLDEGAEAAVLDQLAAAAQWPLPRTLAVCAVPAEAVERVRRRLGSEALGDVIDGCGCLLWPDAAGPGRTEQLERALAQAPAAVGPPVEPAAAPRWWRWSRRLLESGALGEGPRQTDAHMLEVLLGSNDDLLAAIAKRRLAPLAGEAPASRARLQDTLAGWLRHAGSRAAVAEELHVHPQTVHYRMTRLRELFGAALEDPQARLELQLALLAGNVERGIG